MREPRKRLRIIFFDLETLPNPIEALRNWLVLSNYPGITLRAPLNSIICFGYKELDSKWTKVICAWDFKESWEKDVNDDEAVCRAAFEVLSKADVIVTHNGKRFDEKLLKTRLAKYGLVLPKIIHIDTRAEAKKHYYLVNNKLNTVGKFLVGEEKMEHEGWELWVDVYFKIVRAMKKMKAYCRQDVILLEKVFKKMRPNIKGIPNANLFEAENTRCPRCSSLALQSRGAYYSLNKGNKRRMVCLDCGSWSLFDADRDAFPKEL